MKFRKGDQVRISELYPDKEFIGLLGTVTEAGGPAISSFDYVAVFPEEYEVHNHLFYEKELDNPWDPVPEFKNTSEVLDWLSSEE